MAVTRPIRRDSTVGRSFRLMVAILAAAIIITSTVAGLVSRGGAPDRWWQMMLAPIHMVVGVFG